MILNNPMGLHRLISATAEALGMADPYTDLLEFAKRIANVDSGFYGAGEWSGWCAQIRDEARVLVQRVYVGQRIDNPTPTASDPRGTMVRPAQRRGTATSGRRAKKATKHGKNKRARRDSNPRPAD